MREIDADQIAMAVKGLAIEAAYLLGDDVVRALERGLTMETSPAGKAVLEQLLENARIAAEGKFPMCQDTGLAVVFLETEQDVRVTGGGINEAVQEGIRQGYKEGYLRKSVCHPLHGRTRMTILQPLSIRRSSLVRRLG